MAHHKDAIKRIGQSAKANARNRNYKSRMRTQIKKLRAAVESGDAAAAQQQLRETVSVIQRVAQKGMIHSRQASRRVARLNKAVKALVTTEG